MFKHKSKTNGALEILEYAAECTQMSHFWSLQKLAKNALRPSNIRASVSQIEKLCLQATDNVPGQGSHPSLPRITND